MMDEEDSSGKFSNNKVQLGTIAAFLVGLFILVLGAGMFLFKGGSSSQAEDVQIISASSSPVSKVSEIMVDVAGAVVSPGVYKLPKDSRVDDAVVAAGGLSADADRAKINLAAKVVDGQKVQVKAIGEVSGVSTSSSGGPPAGGVVGSSEGGMISINDGSQSQLESLPGIGPVTAQKIITSRPYSALDELVSKKAVGSATFEKLKDLISL